MTKINRVLLLIVCYVGTKMLTHNYYIKMSAYLFFVKSPTFRKSTVYLCHIIIDREQCQLIWQQSKSDLSEIKANTLIALGCNYAALCQPQLCPDQSNYPKGL